MTAPSHRDPTSSADLAAAARGGNGAAWEELFERHLDDLRLFLRARAGAFVLARDSASDLLQSTCREVIEDLADSPPSSEGAFRHRLFLAAERKIVDRARFLRRDKRDAGRLERLDVADRGFEAVDGKAASPSRIAEGREAGERLEQALRRLPEDAREAILLARVVGLSRAEIAERMGKSEGAVRMLLSRSLARLALILDDEKTSSGGVDSDTCP